MVTQIRKGYRSDEGLLALMGLLKVDGIKIGGHLSVWLRMHVYLKQGLRSIVLRSVSRLSGCGLCWLTHTFCRPQIRGLPTYGRRSQQGSSRS